MNVTTITMEPAVAREKLKAYRASRHKDAEEQYRQCAEGYQALAAGTPLLNLDDVFRNVLVDENGRPKLAIARADRREVGFFWGPEQDSAWFDCSKDFQARSFVWRSTLAVSVAMGRTHGLKDGRWDRRVAGYTLIPMVPADIRPKHGQLRNLHILWEVEQWSDKPVRSRAPSDPMLLKHIGGALYAVLAEWDLTPLERAILEGAMQSR